MLANNYFGLFESHYNCIAFKKTGSGSQELKLLSLNRKYTRFNINYQSSFRYSNYYITTIVLLCLVKCINTLCVDTV